VNDPNFELGRFPAAVRARVESELGADERIVWVGRPGARPYVIQTIPFALLGVAFTTYAVNWTSQAATNGYEPWYGFPFITAGLGLCCTPFWAVRIAHRTAYVLTERRAMVFEGGRPYTLRTFLPDRLRELSRKERSDGSGDLVFLQTAEPDSDGLRRVDYGFLTVAHVKQVEELVRRMVERRG
jgi:hypothetical protein